MNWKKIFGYVLSVVDTIILYADVYYRLLISCCMFLVIALTIIAVPEISATVWYDVIDVMFWTGAAFVLSPILHPMIKGVKKRWL